MNNENLNNSGIKIATAAVIENQGSILIAQRARDLLWEFPGGKFEPLESLEACVIREIKEELGLDISMVRQIGKVKGFFRGRDMELFVFHVVSEVRDVTMNVHKDVRWISMHQLKDFVFVEEDREIFKFLADLGLK